MDPDPTAPSYPGARAPDRRRTVDSAGLEIAVYEWGDAEAPALMLAHGGFDFARTYDVFAPLLADGGWRVVSWDQRGHGFSAHAALYSWDADIRDAVAVIDSTTADPVPVVGHSKGGGILLQLAEMVPWRLTRMVNLDGLPSGRKAPDVADHERTRMLAAELASWLDHQRGARSLARKPGTVAELAERRARMNPRLPQDWLEYLAAIGTVEGPDGRRWPLDPQLRMGGFGPFRPDWSLERLPGLGVPLLGVLATIAEPMGWGTSATDVEPFLPPGARIVELADTGHFVHIERPTEVADLVLEFLG
jgi:pimeloyl-ACP methyl ester carboxylesterase